MNRRDFLQCAALLAAGATALPSRWVLSQEQREFLAAQPNFIDRETVKFFDPLQRAAVRAIADQVIPTTETPGALDAGADRFIELMAANWFSDDERALFMQGLAELQARAGGDFAALPVAEQLTLLEALEDEAGDTTWYDLGNVTRVWDETAPFVCQVKELTVLGFMLSEVGSTQFLRENPMGQFDGAVPLASDTSAYAAEMPIRLMTRG